METSGSTPPEPGDGDDPVATDESDLSTEELREQVERKYDFENFGPDDMDEMTAEEWDAVFDPDTWITGQELLDRVEADLKQRVIDRDVFARIEREEDYVLAYSDSGFAVVYPDGSVEGEGTVLRDVKPTIALCSMDSYDVPDVPDGEVLPKPAEVPQGSGELGNTMLQVVAVVQVIAGVVLIGSSFLLDLKNGFERMVLFTAGLGFLIIALVLFFTVANARLSDRFRAEEFRDRLRAINVESGERPDFLPVDEDGQVHFDGDEGTSETVLPPAEESGETTDN